MKKKFRVQDVDCADCAAKMERGIAKLDGVNSVSISFMAQKMMLDAEDEKFEAVLDQAQKIMSSVDAEAKILR